ncbi:30S ribosomal protein [Sporothrix brasiliensis 5110]|uniref:Small ribosomal subunit protein uS7m n=1 Tax=Sporothrix brasiliensis 5110 TaxID=1398154 RepID=A0A0C2F5N0_9PEZI|nr:30S ribosomal protein [Sporothrix brasiliensis 5110]KIH94194.1 30S ribosomal protein [Sporothrix brasiliensis 5110]
MSSSRMAPLWRSSGQCLALRPRATASTATLPRSMAADARARPQLAARRRVAVVPSAVRGFADIATTPESNNSDNNTTHDVDAGGVSQKQALDPSGSGTKANDVEKPHLANARREAILQFERLVKGFAPFERSADGHKFGLTTNATRAAMLDQEALEVGDMTLADGEALPRVGRLQKRHDPVIAQVTRLMMRDGKLAKAQRNMALVLNYLRTAPPPKIDPNFPLMTGNLPAEALPLDPVRYLNVVVDSVAPLIRILHLAGQAGGGRALPVPAPLNERQRRRAAFTWILENASKRPSRGSGRNTFAHRVAEEIIAVAEGRSSVWEKRRMVHKQGTAARANVLALTKKKRH